jgi:hypothetical protein
MSEHPSVYLVRLDISASDSEGLLPFVGLDETPFLPLSYDSFHLLFLDVLVLSPLGYTCSILAYPIKHIENQRVSLPASRMDLATVPCVLKYEQVTKGKVHTQL